MMNIYSRPRIRSWLEVGTRQRIAGTERPVPDQNEHVQIKLKSLKCVLNATTKDNAIPSNRALLFLRALTSSTFSFILESRLWGSFLLSLFHTIF